MKKIDSAKLLWGGPIIKKSVSGLFQGGARLQGIFVVERLGYFIKKSIKQ